MVSQNAQTLDEESRWRLWPAVLALTVLWHLLLFWVQPSWNVPAPPPRVELQQVDPQKLDAIRKQWRAREQAEKQLLLNKDKSKPVPSEENPEARYMSDRNRRVEKEQRARDSNVIPKAGTPSQSQSEAQKPRTPSKPQPKERHKPALGKLGVPMGLTVPNETAATEGEERKQKSTGEEGGDQFVGDKNLPVGNENLLNTQESVFYSFYARIYEAIGPLWQSHIREVPYQRRVNPGEYSTVVDVVLDRSGNLVDVKQLQSSGIPEFDRAVQTSWRRLERFPNPPHGLLNAEGMVHIGWTFTVQVGAGFNLEYLPPRRDY